jgi:hypothetical protein
MKVMEKDLLPFPGIEPRFLGRPARNLVAIPTETSQTYHITILRTLVFLTRDSSDGCQPK